MSANRGTSRDSKGQVKRLLEVLNRHADVIADSLDGAAELTGRGYDNGVAALVDINALMAVDEGQFQLNPRIRAYLSEQLAQFTAFQTLTRITEQIEGARIKFKQICEMKASGDMLDMPALEESLGYTVSEIVHFCATNLLLLQTQMETEFGNVSSFKRKLAQNAFYYAGVQTLLRDINQLRAFTEEVEREAVGRGLFAVRQMLNSRIRVRLPSWMSQLNVIAASLNKRLFDARRLEHELLLLSRTVLWMARNPTRLGLDIEPPLDVDPALLRPRSIKVRPQVDIANAQLGAQQVLVNAAARLPAVKSPWERQQESNAPQYVKSAAMAEVVEVLAPEDELVMSLVEILRSDPRGQPVSLAEWKSSERAAMGLDTGVWLLYAATQLHLLNVHTEFVLEQRRPWDVNDSFTDVLAFIEAPA